MNSKDSWHYASTKKRGSLWSALMRKILMQERSVKGWEQFQMGKRERETLCREGGSTLWWETGRGHGVPRLPKMVLRETCEWGMSRNWQEEKSVREGSRPAPAAPEDSLVCWAKSSAAVTVSFNASDVPFISSPSSSSHQEQLPTQTGLKMKVGPPSFLVFSFFPSFKMDCLIGIRWNSPFLANEFCVLTNMCSHASCSENMEYFEHPSPPNHPSVFSVS